MVSLSLYSVTYNWLYRTCSSRLNDCDTWGHEWARHIIGAWVDNIILSCMKSIVPKDWKHTRRFWLESWCYCSCFSSSCFPSSSDTCGVAKRRRLVSRVCVPWVSGGGGHRKHVVSKTRTNLKDIARFSISWSICIVIARDLTLPFFLQKFLLVEPSHPPSWCFFNSCSSKGSQLTSAFRDTRPNTQR